MGERECQKYLIRKSLQQTSDLDNYRREDLFQMARSCQSETLGLPNFPSRRAVANTVCVFDGLFVVHLRPLQPRYFPRDNVLRTGRNDQESQYVALPRPSSILRSLYHDLQAHADRALSYHLQLSLIFMLSHNHNTVMTYSTEASSWCSPKPVELSAAPRIGNLALSCPELPLPAANGKPTIVTFLRHCGCPGSYIFEPVTLRSIA